ncbi:MAG: carbon-nitrogen hydrolase family protein, partial [Anaerolineae bacterium]|nr:carbon-nitrogen hydrolase family protein [Anaerolineae bacterium]
MAGIQLCPRSGSVAENLDRAKEQVRRAAREGARIACLPEYFATGCFTLDASLSGRRLAEDLSGPTVSAMREVAAGEGTGIIAPIFERAGDSFYSAAVVIDGSGTIVGAYRKQHLPPAGALEQRYFSPGNLGNPVFVLSGLAVGVCLCHDRHFFEIARIHALKGSQVLFVP